MTTSTLTLHGDHAPPGTATPRLAPVRARPPLLAPPRPSPDPGPVAGAAGDPELVGGPDLDLSSNPGPDRRAPLPPLRRAMTHPRLMHYRRLVALVLGLNVVAAALLSARGDLRIADGGAVQSMSAAVLVNLALSVLVRQQHVLNVLYRLAGAAPLGWPLRLRWALSKVYHHGGLHVGGAVAGTAWFVAFAVAASATCSRSPGLVAPGTVVLAGALLVLLVLIVVLALPPVRERFHDAFEASHRLGGWVAIALFWPLTVQGAVAGADRPGTLEAAVTSWQVWLLAVLTASVALPWTRLRRVPVVVERLSSHAAVVRLDYGVTPPVVAVMSIARHPLMDWHTFATVRLPGQSGYRLVVSRAGDWTGGIIDDPPTHVWVKGVPVSNVAGMERLYRRVVYVATGSGIGPLLSQVLAARVPARLIWSTRSPRATYGDALVDLVEAAQPGALVWDTTVRGKPDLPELTREVCEEFDAEAVVVVSNKPTTWSVVHGVERLGIPAMGPIFDS